MDSKEAIIEATIRLIEEKGDDLSQITVREICERAGVGLGLVNYHFGNKDQLIEICVERMINGTIERFRSLEATTQGLDPFEKLAKLGDMTLDFLFAHPAIARISALGDLRHPKADDNVERTQAAYVPLVAACRPDLDETAARRKAFELVTVMQQAFLRSDVLSDELGIDLRDPAGREAFHRQVLHDILEA
jgi:AcrR family transcriptional regulator